MSQLNNLYKFTPNATEQIMLLRHNEQTKVVVVETPIPIASEEEYNMYKKELERHQFEPGYTSPRVVYESGEGVRIPLFCNPPPRYMPSIPTGCFCVGVETEEIPTATAVPFQKEITTKKGRKNKNIPTTVPIGIPVTSINGEKTYLSPDMYCLVGHMFKLGH